MAIFSKLGNYKNTGLLLMRAGLGIMMMIHGYPKLMGGPDLWGKVGSAMGDAGIHFAPVFWGFMAAAAETICGLLAVLGLFFRPACLFIMFTLTIAALHHFSAGEGLSGAAHAIETGIAFTGLLFLGPGKYSVDKK
ncbi:DoxX family protein [Chitinophagaceae bacterium MMS25-I14]